MPDEKSTEKKSRKSLKGREEKGSRERKTNESETEIAKPTKETAERKIEPRDQSKQQNMMEANSAQVRKPAPDFTSNAFVDGQFKSVTNKDYYGKYLVLFFYPSDFTFVCPTEIIAFSDRIKEFKDIGCEVIACSTDSEFSHRAWVMTDRKKGGLEKINFPILADKTLQISSRYGVLIEEEGVAFRGLFIMNEKGIIRHISINDTAVGRNVDEVLRLVQGFQFTDKHGEVCPVNWQPGKKTITPDVNKASKYFASS